MPEFSVNQEYAGRRLDQSATALLPHLSRSRVRALIDGAHLRVNGAPAKPAQKLRAGDLIEVNEPPPEPLETLPQEMALSILYEDEALIVLDKPAGLVIHPGAGNRDGTLVNALLHHCPDLSGIGGIERPGIVHRLDKDTSGCVVVAKTDAAHQSLSRQFAEREVGKIYLAIAEGAFRRSHLLVETPIGRHRVNRQKMAVVSEGRGKLAKTEFFVEAKLPEATLVRCVLHTGRTHQIRVHLNHIGHPLCGDRIYGRAGTWPRQMLHAWQLGFTHPGTGQPMHFTSPVPQDFVQAGVR